MGAAPSSARHLLPGCYHTLCLGVLARHRRHVERTRSSRGSTLIANPMIEEFRQLYGSAEGIRILRAPGRVNLIGEHTDYNLGFVLPVALQLATYVAAAPSADGKLRVYSEDRGELREFDIACLTKTA